MKIIDNLNIRSFKGIENLELEKCSDINIIVGDNNTCKTTVLEAIQLLQYPNNFQKLVKVIRKRYIASRRPIGITVLESFLSMFNAKQDDFSKQVKIQFTSNGLKNVLSINGEVKEVFVTEAELAELSKYQRTRTYEFDEEVPVQEFRGAIDFNDKSVEIFINEIVDDYRYARSTSKEYDNVIRMNYLTSVDHINESFSANRISKTILNDEKSGLLDLIQEFDSDFEGLEIASAKNNPYSATYVKHKKYGFMPLANYGDGLKKVLALASIILNTHDGVLLIDEIETAIHTSALGVVFRWLLAVAKRQNIQIFATTHSEEALRHFLLINEEFDIGLSVYRLENFEGEIICRRFSGEKARRIVIEDGGDLR